MKTQTPQKAFCLLLIFCSTTLGSSAFSRTSAICSGIFQLKNIHQQSSQTQSVAHPLEAIAILNRFTTELETSKIRNSNTALRRVSDNFSGIAAELVNMTAERHHGLDVIGSHLFQNLSENMQGLNLVESVFGCKKAEIASIDSEAFSLRDPHRKLPGLWAKISRISAITTNYAVLPMIAVLMALFVAFRLKNRRRGGRKICRTSMLIVYGEQCTVTHIIEISRRGMKIEAAQKNIEKASVDLYFCGHRIQGEIIWRNEYFAGVKFKAKISQQTLDDVIKKSSAPLNESGLKENATPCFFVGCHTDCPHHLPTAISEKPDALSSQRSHQT